jgi:hypothetical protein
MKITTRPFYPGTDSAFIFGTWSKGVYFGTVHAKQNKRERSKWFQDFHKRAVDLLPTCKVTMAHIDDDTNTLHGYAITQNGVLDWIWVKPLFRMQGIGKLLYKAAGPFTGINLANQTPIGAAIMKSHASHFNHVKEESHEQSNRRPEEDH